MEPSTPVNEMERPNVTLNCQVIDGNPALLVGVRWYLDGELLKELPDCPLNDSVIYSMYDEDLCDVDPSKLLLEYVGRSFQGNYSCEGLNAAGWGPLSNGEELIIYCKPLSFSLSLSISLNVANLHSSFSLLEQIRLGTRVFRTSRKWPSKIVRYC